MFPSFLAFALPAILFLTFWALCYTPLAGLARVVTTGLKSGSAWIARSRVGQWAISHSGPIAPYASILLVMAFGAIAAIGAGYLFGELAEQVRLTTSAVYRADQAIHSGFGLGHQPAMTAGAPRVSTKTGFTSITVVSEQRDGQDARLEGEAGPSSTCRGTGRA
jgi:hypothetical protein